MTFKFDLTFIDVCSLNGYLCYNHCLFILTDNIYVFCILKVIITLYL